MAVRHASEMGVKWPRSEKCVPRAPEERLALIQIKGGARNAQKHAGSVMVLRPSRSCRIRSTPAIRAAPSKGAIIASARYGWRGRDLRNTRFVAPVDSMTNAA